jgi:hypothetical protein
MLPVCNMDYSFTEPPYSVQFYFDKRSTKRWTVAVFESELSRMKLTFSAACPLCKIVMVNIVIIRIYSAVNKSARNRSVSNVGCESVVNCMLSGTCFGVAQEESISH